MVFAVSIGLCMLFMAHSKKESLLNNKYNSVIIIVLMSVIVSINVGFRDFQYIDTINYISIYNSLAHSDFSSIFSYYKGEFLFNLISWLMAKLSISPRVYLIILWVLFFAPFFFALKRLFPVWQVAIALFVFFNYSFFYSYSMNILRQGLALSFLLLSQTYFLDKANRKATISLIVAGLMHWSCIPFSIVLFLLNKINFSLRIVLFIWVLGAAFYLLDFNSYLIGKVGYLIPEMDTYTGSYQMEQYGGKINRLDFFLYSIFGMTSAIIIYYFIYRDELYKKIIITYVAFNSIFLFFGFVSFSDRLGMYSWILIPLLILYPLFKNNNYNPFLVRLVIVIFMMLGIFTGMYEHLEFKSGV